MEDIKKEYDKLLSIDLSTRGKKDILYGIIFLKIENPDWKLFIQHFSIDLKQYINLLIKISDEEHDGYDSIDLTDFFEIISNLNIKEKRKYCEIFIRQLKRQYRENEIAVIQEKLNSIIVKDALKSVYKLKSLLNLIIYFPLINIYTLLITIFIFLVISCLVLLPAPFSFMNWISIEISYVNYVNNYYANHCLNLIYSFLGLTDGFVLKPTNMISSIALIMSKILMYVYIGNLILNKLNDIIKRQ